MAEDGVGSPRGSPSPGHHGDPVERGRHADPRDSPVLRSPVAEHRSPHRLSPVDRNGRAGGHYYPVAAMVNGRQLHHHQNGVSEEGSEGEDSRGESLDDSSSHYDDNAPLDFSLKRKREPVISDVEDEEPPRNDSGMEPITPPPTQEPGDRAFFYRPGPTVFPHVNGLHSPPMPKTENCVSPRQHKGATEPPEKIGEPQTALPGMVPGMTIPTSAAAAAHLQGLVPGFPAAAGLEGLPHHHSGLLSALPFLQMDPRAAAAAAALTAGSSAAKPLPEDQATAAKNGTSRAFKSYPKEPAASLPPLNMYGLPGVPPVLSNADLAAAQAMSANSEELFSQYRHFIQRMQQQEQGHSPGKAPRNGQHGKTKERRISGGSTLSQVSSTTTPPASEQGSPMAGSTPTLTTAMPGGTTPGAPITPVPIPSPHRPLNSTRQGSSSSRKRPKTIPEDLKDMAYWERRRKNNEAAKRSRDARRAKEDEIAIRAAFLEQENLKLRVEVAALKNETSKLRCMLYNS